MNGDIVIKVDKVYKDFLLPHERPGSVKNVFTSMFRHATIKNEKQHALKDISFDIKKGEFFGIVGRNGSGKSTLLKILAGIYQPTKGTLNITGSLVPFIELGVGFNPELTGKDNVYLNGAMLGFSVKEIDAQYDDIVSFAELERFMDQKLKNYSSGMQVRLAFSMAARAKADILLIDEVLAVGDADFQRKCFNYFKKLKKDKTTVVFVSHDMNAIREFCDKAVLIEKNEILTIGKTDLVAQNYSKLFLENSENIITQDTSTDGNRWGNRDVTIENSKASIVGDFIYVTIGIEINKKVDKIIYGLHILAADGSEITAINNIMVNKPSIENISVGDKINIEWKILNIFNDGKYFVTATLIDDLANTLDWINEVAEFTVKRAERSTTAVLPPIEVNLRRLS